MLNLCILIEIERHSFRLLTGQRLIDFKTNWGAIPLSNL